MGQFVDFCLLFTPIILRTPMIDSVDHELDGDAILLAPARVDMLGRKPSEFKLASDEL